MGEPRRATADFLSWLWREERSAARALAIGAGILLICAPVFAASEIAVLSTVRVASARHPAVIRLGAGTYDISQDIGDSDFPDDSTQVSITGPHGQVPGRTIPQVLAPEDLARVFLGAWDCNRVMSFTVRRAGSYRVSVIAGSGLSAAWISEPYSGVIGQLTPWAIGIAAALLIITLRLGLTGRLRRPRVFVPNPR